MAEMPDKGDWLKGVILTWVCQRCGWGNDNNNGPCRKCGSENQDPPRRGGKRKPP
jgi:ribosomal protein L40E